MCSDAEQAKCADEFGENLAWSCANCPRCRPEELHPYTRKLLGFYDLRQAGFTLPNEALTLEEWFDLAKVTKLLDERRAAARMALWALPTATA